MTNRLLWRRGYFKTVARDALDPGVALPQHCFSSSGQRYFDEYSNELAGPIEPVGQWGLQSFRTIDDAVSRALGIELAPD